ncbi:hypothetical protein DITRI_Ditri06bG0038500 [Diplodiscus trichospermus]
MSLYIGHLSSRTRRDELERVFRRFGRCNVRLKDGYGFVVYDYPPSAEKALRALQGRYICGEQLTLTWSNKQPRPFKKFARADRSYDHKPLRVRSSARGGDSGNRKLDLNAQQDYEMNIEQLDGHGVRLNYDDLLDAEIDYHQDHFKEYTGEDNRDYGEQLRNEIVEDEPSLIDGDRWDGQRHDLSNGNDVEHEMEFDRYVGFDMNDENENHQILYSSHSPAAQSPQDKIERELIGDGTMNHSKDSKERQACYSCGALGHKKHNCPRENTSRRCFSRFDQRHDDDISKRYRVQGGLVSFGSSSQGNLLQDKDPLRTRQSKDTRKASGSVKHGRLVENENSSIAKETDRAWEEEYGGNKRRRRRGGTPKTHSAKKAKPIAFAHFPDYSGSRSRSKSRSIKLMPRSISRSRSRSISARARSTSNNLRSSSHYSRSRSSKSSSRSSSPTSLSLSVSLGEPLASSPNKGQLNLKGHLDKSPESKEIMLGGEPAENDVELEIVKLENRVAPVNIANVGSSAKIENVVEKDQAAQIGNSDNHISPRSVPQVQNSATSVSERGAFTAEVLSPENMREIKGGQDFDALETEDVIVPPLKTDSGLTSGHSTSISSEELCMVMKHYGLEPPDENGRHLSAEAYFGSARLWPWEIVYYRRLKKGPISTENYARRVAQNKEFGIVDKYIRSSSGWGELKHP